MNNDENDEEEEEDNDENDEEEEEDNDDEGNLYTSIIIKKTPLAVLQNNKTITTTIKITHKQ